MASHISTLTGWIFGGLVGIILWAAISSAIQWNPPESQNRIFTTVAVANGFALVLGVSPLRRLALEMLPLTPLVTVEFPALVQAVVNVGTVLTLLVGMGNMIENSGWYGFALFWVGFIGGALLLIVPLIGLVLLTGAVLLMAFAPT